MGLTYGGYGGPALQAIMENRLDVEVDRTRNRRADLCKRSSRIFGSLLYSYLFASKRRIDESTVASNLFFSAVHSTSGIAAGFWSNSISAFARSQ